MNYWGTRRVGNRKNRRKHSGRHNSSDNIPLSRKKAAAQI